MRVLIIADPHVPIPPVRYGGTERMVALTCRMLQSRGHSVTLLAGPGSNDYGGGTVVHLAPTHARHSRWWRKSLFQWLSWHAATEADVIINCGRLDYLPAVVVSGVPLVIWFHNPVRQADINFMNRIRGRRRCLLFVSENQREHLKNVGEAVIAHNAVDTDYFGLSATAAQPGYLLYLGRITRNKGTHFAIDVARRSGMLLKIAGNVPDAAEDRGFFKEVIEPQLGKGCIWVGEVDDGQKRSLLQSASALLFPIKWTEPFGIVMSESLACGTPVIALECASVPEVLRDGETGFVCANVDEMVAAVAKIDTISRERCRREAVSRFSPEPFYERICEAIKIAQTGPAALTGVKRGADAAFRKWRPRIDARQRKVLVIADPKIEVPPKFYGGAERIAGLLCHGLQLAGWNVRLLARRGSTNFGDGVWSHALPKTSLASRVFRKLLFYRSSKRAALGCDVVVNFGRIDYLRQLLHGEVPMVLRFGNPVTQETVDFINQRRKRHLAYVFISKDQCRELRGAEPQKIVYNAVDTDVFSPGPPLAGPRRSLLFVGRLTRNKGVHLAVEVARQTGRSLILAGNLSDEPEETKFFAQEIAPLLGPNCQWVGEVDDIRKRSLIREAEATLFPIQWREPFGLVMAESLACGTPVIAMAQGSTPEVVRHGANGFLCRSSDEMCQAIARLDAISREECRRDALERFSPRVYIDQMLDAIELACAGEVPTQGREGH